MSNKLSLKIVSPSKLVYDKEVEMVIMRTATGDLGVLKGHENLSTVLDLGVMKIIDGETEEYISMLGGFAEVTKDGVSILTDCAELASEIDIARAEEAKKRAEQRIQSKNSDTDILRAELALRRSTVRIETAKHK